MEEADRVMTTSLRRVCSLLASNTAPENESLLRGENILTRSQRRKLEESADALQLSATLNSPDATEKLRVTMLQASVNRHRSTAGR